MLIPKIKFYFSDDKKCYIAFLHQNALMKILQGLSKVSQTIITIYVHFNEDEVLSHKPTF